MLLRFSVENYKSFKDKSKLDMTSSENKDHIDSLIKINDNMFLPLAAIFGDNASGKSNLFDAFLFMQDKVLGINKDNDEINTFLFDKEYIEKPTEFEIAIYSKEIDKELRYGFVIKQNEILEEWLFEKNILKSTSAKEKCVYYRSKVDNLESNLKGDELKEINFVSSLTTSKELIITNLGKRKISIYKIVYEWFKQKLLCINYSYQSLINSYNQDYLEILYNNIDIKNEVEKIIKEVDTSINKIKIVEEIDIFQNRIYKPYSIHITDNKESLAMPFYLESSGIKKIFNLILHILNSLRNGNTLLIDDLDSNLHPLLLRYIVRMYSNKLINTGGGQLIFSSHNLICLDLNNLRRDEIWFVEKNNQESTIFSLYDFKDQIKNDFDYYKYYLNGRFGAVPFTKM